MSAPEHWNHFRDQYIFAVDAFLDQLIREAFQRINESSSLRRAPRYNLKEVETYWEFRADDPINLMRRMEPLFFCLGRTSNIRRYPNMHSQVGLENHSAVLQCEFVEGVKAKVYAKTTKRVRVEMTRDLASARLPGAAHTFGALSGIISLIDDIALLEAGEVQMLLETIEQAVPADVRQMPPYELVRLILTTSPDPTVQAVLLSTIISERDEHPTFPFVIEAAR